MNRRVLTIFGTRPEAIKLAPVVRLLAETKGFESRVCVTAQHREMLDPVLSFFGIRPHSDLDLMTRGQDLSDFSARALVGVRDVLRAERPHLVLVQGDTTTCFIAALAAFYEGIPVGHVEAGLRTYDLSAPFPEEGNRRLVGQIARYHFAPTDRARANLEAERVPSDRIHVTGNTVIDALMFARGKISSYSACHWVKAVGPCLYSKLVAGSRKTILITGHRRENFGQGLRNIVSAIRTLAERNRNWDFIYPAHLNPNVQEPVLSLLSNIENIYVMKPVEYPSFVWLLEKSDLVLTDSGGIQEEAPTLGKPVLVTRRRTERPEAIEAGAARLVGDREKDIVSAVENMLGDQMLYQSMAQARNPFGDGRAAERIVAVLKTSRL